MWQACRVGLKSLPEVTALHLAQVRLPEAHPAAAFGSSVPVYGFAIGHPDGTILVDTGVGHGSAVIDDLYQPERSELDECLIRIGVEIERDRGCQQPLAFRPLRPEPTASWACDALLLASLRNSYCQCRSVLHRRRLGDRAGITATDGSRR
jgi:hypothetical protein